MRRFIARTGDDGQCGVWDLSREAWSIPPSRDASEAARIADSMEQASLGVLAAMTGMFGRIAFESLCASVPLCVAAPLCPRLSWLELNAEHRN